MTDTSTDDADLVDYANTYENPHLMHEIAASGSEGRGIGALSYIHQHRTGMSMDASDAAVVEFVDAALRRGLIVEVGRTQESRGRFVLPQHRLIGLRQKIATGDQRAGVDHAGFLWDAIAGAGTAGQSSLALLELLRDTWPDLSQGQAVDYLTAWIQNALAVCAIYPHQQPPAGSGLDWYVTPDNLVRVEPRKVLVTVGLPVGLDYLAAILSAAGREHTRRSGQVGELTTDYMEIAGGVLTVYDRPEQSK